MSKAEQLYAVLLKSGHGYKQEMIDGADQLKPVAVHKGSLLVYLDSLTANRMQEKYDRLVNYKLADRCDVHHSEVVLFVAGSSILHINTLQRDYLLGVKQTHYRMEVLERLQWVESLTVGSNVYVTIATIPTPVRGIIRYIGELPGEEGRKFGIELMEHRGEGTHNGEFKGHKYFKCDKDCAVFIAMDKITNRNAAEAAKVTKTPDTSTPKQLARDTIPIKANDPITFCDKHDILYKGVAKWIGTDKSSDTIIIGIEVNSGISIDDFPYHVKIEADEEQFSSDKSKIFLPISYVRPDTSTKSGDADSHGHVENIIPTKANNPHNLVVGSAVQYHNSEQYGIIKWIGTLQSASKVTFAGVEMEDYVDSYAGSDGSWAGVKYFSCKPNKGKFVMLSLLKPDQRIKPDVILPETYSQENSQSNSDSHKEIVTDGTQLVDTNPYSLGIGSVIQYGEPDQCGIIKWMGNLPNETEVYAGLEMDADVDEEYDDGVWLGIQYYHCKPRRGIFVRLSALKPGRRTMTVFEDQPSGKPPTELNTTKSTSFGFSVSSHQNPYNLTVGCVVQYGRPPKYGVIEWIGSFPEDKKTVYAGLIMDKSIVRNAHDGVWNGVRYYHCKQNRGSFIPLKNLKPCNEARRRKCSADDILLRYADETNVTEHRSLIPRQPSVDCVLSPVPTPLKLHQNPYKIEIESTVQYGEPPLYGVIKWIGVLPGRENLYAGVEMEEIADNYTDGMFEGVRYFKSRAGRGKFVQLQILQPDRRFVDNTTPKQVFKVGSRVQFGIPKEYGVIKWIGSVSDSNEEYVKVETENNKESGLIPLFGVQLDSRHDDNLSLQTESVRVGESDKFNIPALQQPQSISIMLEVGSAIQFGDPVQYGTIKRIEEDPILNKEIAEVETEDGKHLKIPLEEAKPESRFNCLDAKSSIEDKQSDDMSHVLPHPVLEVGSLIQFGNPVQYGVIKDFKNDSYNKCAVIETEDQQYKTIPLVELQPDSRFTSSAQEEKSQNISTKLEIGSMVQFGNPVQYGVIKKIETAVDTLEEIAEVETENNQLKKIPLTELQPDYRFIIDVNEIEGNINPLEKEYYVHDEALFPVPPADKFDAGKHTDTKGIQGYKNSCYLDATLYGLFTFSDAFDILILEDHTTNAEELDLQNRLKSKIVYPLRKKGIVVQKSVEEFREHLANLQNMKGLTSEEKDPEEFLNILFKHVLHLDPFITIRRPSGIDKEFFVQLFVEPDKDKPAVNTQKLLNKMFQEQNITFVEYPTRLLLQMPRYGKRFKSFQRVIPSLELNVTSLCITSGLCSICKHRMGHVCIDCTKEKSQTQYYCNTCSPRWHQAYYNNQKHEFSNEDFDTGALQLLSVLFIETSHYVCFTRITGSSGKDEWVFFDSMAERQDNGYNIPKVTHCTDCLQEFVYGKKNIGRMPSKKLPELVRRFVEDAYLCVYIDHDGVMYN